MAKNETEPGKSNKQKGKFKSNPPTTSSNFIVKPKEKRFSKEETVPSVEDSKPTKKPFDKKTYRLKKYSNKFKVQQWEDNRKKVVLRKYFREAKHLDNNFDVTKVYNDPRNRDSDDDNQTPVDQNNSANKNKKPFQRAREEFQRIKEVKNTKRENILKAKAEKEEALKKYRKEKAIKFKRLSRKTKKGQPIMKDRIEMLLEKIQKSV